MIDFETAADGGGDGVQVALAGWRWLESAPTIIPDEA